MNKERILERSEACKGRKLDVSLHWVRAALVSFKQLELRDT
jgi:hypothetical protein